MIITTVGSMGTAKTSLLIYLYSLLIKQKKDVFPRIFTSFYDPNRNCISKKKIKYGNSTQVISRILDSVVAEKLDDETNFEKSFDEKRPGVYVFDEFQFTGENALKKVIDSGQRDTLHLFALNTNYENVMWPSIRKVCLVSDYIFVVENNDLKKNRINQEGEIRNTNYMTVNGKFDLIYDSDAVIDFDSCSKETWYEYATEYFAKKLDDYKGDSAKMLSENPSLTKSFTKLFRLWRGEEKSMKILKNI